jgi:hypothetical protein
MSYMLLLNEYNLLSNLLLLEDIRCVMHLEVTFIYLFICSLFNCAFSVTQTEQCQMKGW